MDYRWENPSDSLAVAEALSLQRFDARCHAEPAGERPEPQRREPAACASEWSPDPACALATGHAVRPACPAYGGSSRGVRRSTSADPLSQRSSRSSRRSTHGRAGDLLRTASNRPNWREDSMSQRRGGIGVHPWSAPRRGPPNMEHGSPMNSRSATRATEISRFLAVRAASSRRGKRAHAERSSTCTRVFSVRAYSARSASRSCQTAKSRAS